MKSIITLLISMLALSVFSQTNQTAFPELMSCTNTVLMTNAIFRCAVGNKLFFENSEGEHGFNSQCLSTNVLKDLGFTKEALDSVQTNQLLKDRLYWANHNQQLTQLALQQKQQELAAENARQAREKANAAAIKAGEDAYNQQVRNRAAPNPSTDIGTMMLEKSTQ